MALEGKTRRQALTEFREKEILAAARKVFGERGYGASTVDDIASEAGIAKGTIYLYYASKEEIFWAALTSRFRELQEQARQAMAAEVSTAGKLQAWLGVRFDFLRSDEQFMRMYVTEFGHVCRAHGGPMHALYQDGVNLLVEVLEEGVRRGELRPMPLVETATSFADLSKAIFTTKFSGLIGLDASLDGARFIFDLFWNGVHA